VPAAAPATEPLSRNVLPEGFGRPARPAKVAYTAPTLDAAPGTTGVTTTSGAGPAGAINGDEAQSRNALCACGSGRKYKRCHGDPRAGR
jgi:preprotein translocase subunit SecA